MDPVKLKNEQQHNLFSKKKDSTTKQKINFRSNYNERTSIKL